MRYLIAIVLSIFIMTSVDNPGFADIGTWLVYSADTEAAGGSADNECTIMVIGGQATADGRPILWKNRDVTNADQKFRYVPAREFPDGTTYAFNGNFYTNNSYRCYMGVNEVGFGIINANCYNLPDIMADGFDDGDLMRVALERCRTVADWERILDISDQLGRKDPWIFGAFDADGTTRLYECGNNFHIIYDTANPQDAPGGMIVRTVFALAGGPTDEGKVRYDRAVHLAYDRPTMQPIDIRYILQTMARDFYTPDRDPYPLPFYGRVGDLPEGIVCTAETINRFKTRSCSIIRGVLPDENPRLATTFAILGQPVLSTAVPLWVAAECVPECLYNGIQAPWYSLIAERLNELYPLKEPDRYIHMYAPYLLDSLGNGVLSYTLNLEDWGMEQAHQYLEQWREQGFNAAEVEEAQESICGTIWAGMLAESDNPIMPRSEDESKMPAVKRTALLPDGFAISNYPNPFNSTTTINFNIPADIDPHRVKIRIYDVLGHLIASPGFTEPQGGRGSANWSGLDDRGNAVAAGVYFYSLEVGSLKTTGKMLLLK